MWKTTYHYKTDRDIWREYFEKEYTRLRSRIDWFGPSEEDCRKWAAEYADRMLKAEKERFTPAEGEA